MRRIGLLGGCVLAVSMVGCVGPRVMGFEGNEILTSPDGRVVIKGFGDKLSYNIVCTVSPGAYGSQRSSRNKGKVNVLNYVEGEYENTVTAKMLLLYAMTERLAAMDMLLSQVCIAYGNGVFGRAGSKDAREAYTVFVTSLLKQFSAEVLPPVDHRAAEEAKEEKAGASDSAETSTSGEDKSGTSGGSLCAPILYRQRRSRESRLSPRAEAFGAAQLPQNTALFGH